MHPVHCERNQFGERHLAFGNKLLFFGRNGEVVQRNSVQAGLLHVWTDFDGEAMVKAGDLNTVANEATQTAAVAAPATPPEVR